MFWELTRAGCASATHQVFKLCRQAAVVGLLHVHDFGVRAEDVELSGPKTKGKKTSSETFDSPFKCLDVRVWETLPSDCSHVPRLPEKFRPHIFSKKARVCA